MNESLNEGYLYFFSAKKRKWKKFYVKVYPESLSIFAKPDGIFADKIIKFTTHSVCVLVPEYELAGPSNITSPVFMCSDTGFEEPVYFAAFTKEDTWRWMLYIVSQMAQSHDITNSKELEWFGNANAQPIHMRRSKSEETLSDSNKVGKSYAPSRKISDKSGPSGSSRKKQLFYDTSCLTEWINMSGLPGTNAGKQRWCVLRSPFLFIYKTYQTGKCIDWLNVEFFESCKKDIGLQSEKKCFSLTLSTSDTTLNLSFEDISACEKFYEQLNRVIIARSGQNQKISLKDKKQFSNARIASCMIDSKISKGGVLKKLGGKQASETASGSFQPRFIIVYQKMLFYYKTGTLEIPQGFVSLNGYDSCNVLNVPNKEFAIIDSTGALRPFVFQASNTEVMNEWVMVIRASFNS